MWLLLASALAVVVLVRYLKPRATSLAHFKGITMWEVFVLKNIHPRVTAMRREQFVCLHTPAFSALLATTPDAAKFVLSDPTSFPKTTRKMFPKQDDYLLFDKNILVDNGDKWRQYRNTLSPPFHFDAVKQWIPHFHQLTLELMQHWLPLVSRSEFIDVSHWLPLFTFDVLGATVLSRSFDAMKGSGGNELNALSVLLQSGVRPSIMVIALLEKLSGITLLSGVYRNLDILNKFFIEIINSRKNKNTNDGTFDLIDVMVRAHDPTWSDHELVSNALIMFVAGHETTSSALAWLFYHLAQNKSVQDKVFDEVQRVLKGRPVDQESLKELVYMQCVIKENLRMQPPLLMASMRMAERDMEFEGKVIPKGTRVSVDIYAIHHSPEYWDQPELFNPDRFNKPTVPFSYLPFSLKSRACLGNQFSLVEQAVFFATFMQHYKVDDIRAFRPYVGNHPAFNQPKELKVSLIQV